MICPICKAELEYKAVPVFGDFNLGVSQDWWECVSCGYNSQYSKEKPISNEVAAKIAGE